jgi:lysyl-tRNA synthetase class 2
VGAVLVAMLLAISVKQFPGKPDPRSLRKLRVAAPLLAGVFFTYGILGLFLMRGRLGIHSVNAYRLAYRSIAVAVGDSGLHFTGSAIAFKGSMTAIAIGGIAFLLFLLLRPYREKGAQAPELRQRARRVVEDYGSDSLAYFNMRHDKSVFFHGDECFLAYKVVGDVAVISGDPVGPSEQIPDTIRAFNDYCLARGWRLTILGASGTMMPYYEEVELRGFSLGEEAIVKVENFTLDGRQARKLRQSVNKIARDGYTMEFMYTASIPGHMKHELARISVDWRGGKQETGFSMGLGRLMSSEDPDCLLAVAYDADARPAGFLHFVPMYPHVGYSLDVHRSKIDSPGGAVRIHDRQNRGVPAFGGLPADVAALPGVLRALQGRPGDAGEPAVEDPREIPRPVSPHHVGLPLRQEVQSYVEEALPASRRHYRPVAGRHRRDRRRVGICGYEALRP